MRAFHRGRLLALAFLLLSLVLDASAAQGVTASGMLLRANRQHRSILVSINAAPGYSGPRVARLQLAPGEHLRDLEPGMLVKFVLKSGASALHARQLRAVPYRSQQEEQREVCQLTVLSHVLPDARLGSGSSPAKLLALGDKARDFSLHDQNGRLISLSALAGKLVVIDFIYTNCPFPNYCVRMSDNLWQLQRRFSTLLGKRVVLLSVSLDPVHDTPRQLRHYARRWKADRNWHFLTGNPAAVRSMSAQFGVVYQEQEMGMVAHSLHTVIIGPHGRLEANLVGNRYTGTQLGDLVRTLLAHRMAYGN